MSELSTAHNVHSSPDSNTSSSIDSDKSSHKRTPARIAIIGGGIAGLTAAYDLTRHKPNGTIPPTVTIFEGSARLGGLAAGFKGRSEWDWPLEYFYHHLFTNDDAIIGLTEELGLSRLLKTHSPTTVMYYQGDMYPFDSPLRLLQFPHLSLVNKLRMGLVLAWLRYHPRPPWRTYDRLLADEWLARWMGRDGYETLWQPMLQGKFDTHYKEVNLAWFWARIYKRTPKLAYYYGGFQAFVDGLANRVQKQGVSIRTSAPVEAIRPLPSGRFTVTADGAKDGAKDGTESEPDEEFDMVLSTVSPGLMSRFVPELPPSYLQELQNLQSMGAIVLTVALDRQFMEDVYWVNVPKPEGLPFLALVEHTNMINPKHYGGDRLLYLGNYLDTDHRYFTMNAEELLAEFMPHLTHFNSDFKPEWVTGVWVHKAKYAQPVPPIGYADMIPDIRTPLANLYFASMSQVYPWDRGTNYAVEMGRNVAQMILEDIKKLPASKNN